MKLEVKLSLFMAAVALCTFLYPVFRNNTGDSERTNVELAQMRTCMEHAREDREALNKLVLKISEDLDAVKVDLAVLKAKVEH